MIAQISRTMKREFLWKLLLSRSVVHKYWKPNRLNTLSSVFLIVSAFPVAILVCPLLWLRKLIGRKICVYEFRIQGEFALLIDHFERIRSSRTQDWSSVVVVIRSTFRHKGLAHLYHSQLGCRVMWSVSVSAWLAQVLFLQPTIVLERRILFSKNYFSLDMAVDPISPSNRLLRLREQTLAEIGCSQSKYVTMAVFTSTEDEREEPDYAAKHKPRETAGADLAEPVDFLRAKGIDVIMLGFLDAGKAHVPRQMPRLKEFAAVGGPVEVALASGCKYFWTDGGNGRSGSGHLLAREC